MMNKNKLIKNILDVSKVECCYPKERNEVIEKLNNASIKDLSSIYKFLVSNHINTHDLVHCNSIDDVVEYVTNNLI